MSWARRRQLQRAILPACSGLLAQFAVQGREVRGQAREHVAFRHIVADLDGAGEAEGIGAAVALDDDAVEAEERPAVHAARVHAVLQLAQPALGQERAELAGRELVRASRT